MDETPQLLLIGAVAAVGILHTMVPDHWVPITLIARQRGWSRRETARNAFVAGTGHVVSTLIIAAVVWIAGAAFAERFGGLVDTVASLALIGFGVWIAVSAWREVRTAAGHHHHHHGHARGHHHDHAHEAPALLRHAHPHRHGDGAAHIHWHDHAPATAHAVAPMALGGEAPPHQHTHAATGRTALLLILGSSPMVEGIPAFFAAGRYGAGLIAVMAAIFAAATIATYVGLCVISMTGLNRVTLGPLERFGEVLSGTLIAALGVVFWVWPVL